MIKKPLALILAVVLFITSFSSCSSKKSHTVTAGDGFVSSGVFAYYLDKIMSDPKEYGVNAENKNELFEKTTELCCNHIATESLMKEKKITLSRSYKAEVAEETENEWSLFGEYYKSIGVSKPDLTEINTFKARKHQLVDYFFGPSGEKPVSDAELKQKFVEIYIGFKAFEGSFAKTNIKGETVDMTEKEKEKLIARFRKMANKINEGASIDSVYEDYCTSQGLLAISTPEVILMKNKDPMYADDFFKKVSTISHSKAAPVTSGSSVYVVQRVTIATSDEDAFSQYRTEVLREMKMPAVEKKIAAVAKELKPEYNSSAASKIYKTVSAAHTEND